MADFRANYNITAPGKMSQTQSQRRIPIILHEKPILYNFWRNKLIRKWRHRSINQDFVIEIFFFWKVHSNRNWQRFVGSFRRTQQHLTTRNWQKVESLENKMLFISSGIIGKTNHPLYIDVLQNTHLPAAASSHEHLQLKCLQQQVRATLLE